jgi:glycosyltransferase involved in cell wall biosynthesis
MLKKKAQIFSITIGIPAYNEEANIKNLLKSIFNQQGNFVIKKVTVACDGCIDRTANFVKSLQKKHSTLKLIDGKKQLGKVQRLNQLYKLNSSDIFISFDADIFLKNNQTISYLLEPFLDEQVMITAGNNVPVEGQTFVQKITAASDILWQQIKVNYDNGSNIFCNSGSATALRKKITSHFSYPKNIVADQQFLYQSILRDYPNSFRFAKKAVYLYRTPDNLEDYFLQAHRSLTEKNQVIELIGSESSHAYDIPISHKLKVIASYLFKNPLYTSLALGLMIWLRIFFPYTDHLNQQGLWKMVSSTKKVVK